MTGTAWAVAGLAMLHLTGTGALPKEVAARGVAEDRPGRAIRVLIFRDARSLSVRVGAAVAVENPETEEYAMAGRGALITLQARGGTVVAQGNGLGMVGPVLHLVPLEEGASAVVSAVGGTGRRGAYPGRLEVGAENGTLSMVEQVDLEEYVAGVLAAEVPSSFPPEAVKAQAIAARTYALFHLGDHLAQGADLCGEVHCQAFHGVPAEDSTAWRAAQETAGQVLVYGGLLIDAQYSAACSGQTVAAWETRQGKLLPYLSGAEDRSDGRAYCAYGHEVRWTKRVTYSEAQQLVSRNLKTVLGSLTLVPGRLLALQVAQRSGNRVRWLEVKTTTGRYRVMGDAMRWLFGTGRPGPSGLRSTRFELKTGRDRRGRPRSFTFVGAGHGHGIGMCQWGARGRALDGQTAEEILTAYYPGAIVHRLGFE